MSGPRDAHSAGGDGQAEETGPRYEVALQVDGQTLPLKEFLHDMIGGAVAGLVSGLRGVDDPRDVEIRVRKR